MRVNNQWMREYHEPVVIIMAVNNNSWRADASYHNGRDVAPTHTLCQIRGDIIQSKQSGLFLEASTPSSFLMDASERRIPSASLIYGTRSFPGSFFINKIPSGFYHLFSSISRGFCRIIHCFIQVFHTILN